MLRIMYTIYHEIPHHDLVFSPLLFPGLKSGSAPPCRFFVSVLDTGGASRLSWGAKGSFRG